MKKKTTPLLWAAVAGIVLCATVYAFLILKKDDQDVEGQPLEN